MSACPRRDRITIANLRLNPRIGVTPGERRLPQPVCADIRLSGDFGEAAATDQLERTVNYSRVVEVVEAAAAERPYNLIESLAYEIARQVRASFEVHEVTVRVRKMPKSLMEKVDFVEVEIQVP